MIIEINNGDYKVEVKEKNLIVKDKKLYNTKTKQFEGIEGDIVLFQFKTDKGIGGFKGYVEGYTNGEKIKIRGIDTIHENITSQRIEHISVVTGVIDENNVETETVYSD